MLEALAAGVKNLPAPNVGIPLQCTHRYPQYTARLTAGVWLMMVISALAAVGDNLPADPDQTKFANLSGSELVAKLSDLSTRQRAYYELWRRAKSKADEGFAAFSAEFFNPELLSCPQRAGESPIYLLLSGLYRRTHTFDPDDYEVGNPSELFPPVTGLLQRGRDEFALVHAFTSDGRNIEPFGPDGMTGGSLADVNGDGIIEHVDVCNSDRNDIGHADVLTVETVAAKTPNGCWPSFSIGALTNGHFDSRIQMAMESQTCRPVRAPRTD